MEAIFDTCIKKAGIFHDFIHGFRVIRGAGASIMEINIVRDLESVEQ